VNDDFDPESVAGLEGLPPEDARIQTLGPRERAYLRELRSFETQAEPPAGARVDDAERQLAVVLERELGTERPEETSPQARAVPDRSRGLLTWFLAPPRRRPVLAFAVLVIVAGAMWVSTVNRRSDQPPAPAGVPQGVTPNAGAQVPPAQEPTLATDAPVMRGESETLEGELTSSATRSSDGTIRLEWKASPEADRYTLTFFSADLQEIARLSDLRETRFDLAASSMPPALRSAKPVLWRVSAMHGADEMARSKMTAIPLR
jgi:hypothetical protein